MSCTLWDLNHGVPLFCCRGAEFLESCVWQGRGSAGEADYGTIGPAWRLVAPAIMDLLAMVIMEGNWQDHWVSAIKKRNALVKY